MADTDSWRLKLGRAKDHFIDLKRHAQAYSDEHPYELERVIHKRSKNGEFSYVLRMTKNPEPIVMLCAGDLIHNLRSALDHVFYACRPTRDRNNAMFPIEQVDPWLKDSHRRFVIRDPEVRKRFRRQIRGLALDLMALIHFYQP